MLPRKFYLDNFFEGLMPDTNFGTMKCDIYEKDGAYHIEADLPGIDKKDINIECNNGYITIKASMENSKKEEDKNFIRQERSYGSVERKFYVGDVDAEDISAKFNNGVLKVTVPKVDGEKSKKIIEIK